MAEKRFIKGLFKDTAHIDQPAGSWRYAKNAIINDKKGSVSNEGGTDYNTNITNKLKPLHNYKVIGAIEVDQDRTVLFLKKTTANFDSQIGLWKDGSYTTLYDPDPITQGHDLSFSIDHPIEGTFKINAKEDLIVYWTDDLNPPRAFNIDRQQRALAASTTPNPTTELYGINAWTANDKHHVELLNLFPYSGPVPHVELDEGDGTYQGSIIEGGGLRTGVYYLALAYVDDDFVATNYVTIANPISIVDEFDHTRPTAKKDGMKEGSQTSKAIKWQITNLNTDYSFIRATVVRKMGDATEAFKLNDLSFSTSSIDVVFSGTEGYVPSSVEDIIIDTISYETAKTINQLDGILYLGNVTGTQDVGYQKYANNIELHSLTKTITDFDEYWATIDNFESGFGNLPVDKGNSVDQTKSYRHLPNIFKYRGYMRDEVYAFYIAFIMNDGSMSYAYHIPGRDVVTTDDELAEPSGNYISNDLKDLSRAYARNFHFLEYSDPNIYAGSNWMNYWENATEIYPPTDDFEIWDGASNVAIGNLQGSNVRHHHFPSNKNDNRQTIVGNNCTTENAESIPVNVATYQNLELEFNQNNNGHHVELPTYPSWRKHKFHDEHNVANDQDAVNALWNGSTTLTANQPMDVNVWYFMVLKQMTNNDPNKPVKTRIGTDSKSYGATSACEDEVCPTGAWGCFQWPGCGDGGLLAYRAVDFNWATGGNCGSGVTIHLEPGESIWIEGNADGNTQSDVRQANISEYDWNCNQSTRTHSGGSTYEYEHTHVRFSITSSINIIDIDEYSDALISHDVDILGFQLRDIKIPKDIADKVQGFRIYYANREHSNKRILGQSILMPMARRYAQMGICSEAINSTNFEESQHILSTLQSQPEYFYHVEPWALNTTDYFPLITTMWDDPNNAILTDREGYKGFSFHDFHLLRSHNSLVPATHITLEYAVENFAWNGPAIDQDKKMTSTLEHPDSIATISEEWGWDTEYNCYPQRVNSAIFIGHRYDNVTDRLPRIIGQKAKTYLRGDSIFNGQELGFGGKVFNEFGTSCIIFNLMDGHELHAVATRNTPGGATGNLFDNYGLNHEGGWSLLVNPLHQPAPGHSPVTHDRSNYWLINLHAFKTDLYKSIDSQDLIWTGFEIIGNDLDNFTADESGNMGTGTGNTEDIVSEGIFGGDTFICRHGFPISLKPSNTQEESTPRRAVHFHINESPDNINFRHTESDDSFYFPGTPAREMLKYSGLKDFNSQDNLKYNANYSEVNDIRPAFPLPLRETKQEDFSTRTHRSAKEDTSSLIDNYRIFLANQYKDLPKNRGELWKLSTFSNLLFFHMEETLYKAKGKQQMQMKDGSEAFIGSGDIFAQEPDEVIHTKGGFGGTKSQWAALTTRHGYFFVDKDSRKVFLMKEQLAEISSLGLETWFRDNLRFTLENYGLNPNSVIDNPIVGMGFHSVWDPKYKRIILTKRDLVPTALFLNKYNTGVYPIPYGNVRYNSSTGFYQVRIACLSLPGVSCSEWVDIEWSNTAYFEPGNGWTISYYPEMGVWVSFHDYIPYIYFNTSTDFYSLTDQHPAPVASWSTLTATQKRDYATDNATLYGNSVIWKHNSDTKGILYQENESPSTSGLSNTAWLDLVTYYNFEFEFIHNDLSSIDQLYSSFNYTLEAFNSDGINILNHGFTSFYLYNTLQLSEEYNLEYLINTRRVGNNWKVNKFRDMAALATDTSSYYTATGSNIIGGTNTGTITTSSTNNMFTISGMNETINSNYIDSTKNWDKKKKFIDKWIGIRLIYNNISNNLLNLYSTNVEARKFYR